MAQTVRSVHAMAHSVVARTRPVVGLLLLAVILVLIAYHGPLANYLMSWGAYLSRIRCPRGVPFKCTWTNQLGNR